MAKLQDILELQKAGFNADEIAKLLPLVAEDKPVEVKEVKVETPVAETPTPTVEEPKPEKVVDKLDELIKKLELNGIFNSQQPSQEKESLEDIMANIINP